MYEWDWSWVYQYKEELIDASLITVKLNIYILIFGSVLGLFIALAKRNKYKLIRILAHIYIDLFRTLPVLVLIVWFYFCLPLLFGIKTDSFNSGVVVLSLNLAAFIAEIIDTGIQSIPKYHIDSSKIMGFSKLQSLKYIIIPLALRNMIPPLVGQYITSIKLSVLTSVIAVPELLNVTQDLISQTYRPLEFYTVLAIIFLILLLPLTYFSKYLEYKYNLNR